MKLEILETLIKENVITLKEALAFLNITESSKFETTITNYWTSTYTYPLKNSVLFFS
jgi:hypothetical protein